MKSKKCISQFLPLLIFGLAVLLCGSTEAAAAIAKISGFTGKALLHSGADIMLITRIGQEINVGDFVQTENGEAEITFTDGALMKVSPYTKTMIQEASEESGAWIFKTVQATRRITCFIGKLWFKTGSSNKKLFMQSPTAVAGIRGSEGDFGFNPDPARLQTFLNLYAGEAAVAGNVIRGFFDNPGITAAQKSAVYQQLETAYARVVATAAANAAPNVSENQKTLNDANARLAALDVAKQAATILIQSNPDAAVRNQAQAAIAVIDPMITNNQALVTQARTGITGPTTEITTTVLPAPPTTVATTTLTTGPTTISTTTTIAPSPLTTIWTTTSTTSTLTTVTPSR